MPDIHRLLIFTCPNGHKVAINPAFVTSVYTDRNYGEPLHVWIAVNGAPWPYQLAETYAIEDVIATLNREHEKHVR